MSLSRWEVPALLVALGAAIASVVVLAYGGVDIGLTLRADNGRVYVADVVPDGIAERSGFVPWLPILDMTLRDGSDVKRGEPLGQSVSGIPMLQTKPLPWIPVARSLTEYPPAFRPPAEAVDEARIQSIVGGDVDPDTGWVGTYAQLNRADNESWLRASVWLLALGLAVGIGVWRSLVHGLAGDRGREHAVILGAAAATPFLLVPVVLAGALVGIAAGYAVPLALSLLIGLALAVRVTDSALRRTAIAGTLAATGLAGLYVFRHLTTFEPYRDDRAAILVLVAGIAIVPALVLAFGSRQRMRERAQLLSLALVPAAALTAIVPLGDVPLLPLILLVLLLGWQLLVLQRASALVGGWWHALLPTAAAEVEGDGLSRTTGAVWRDRAVLALVALVAVACLMNANPWTAIVGVGLAAAVAMAVSRGFLGADWTDAAVPLGAAVGLPILILPFPAWEYGGAMGWASSPVALVALGVAHVLVGRHDVAAWRGRLLAGAGVMAALAIWFGASHLTLALMLAGMVPLVPGLPVAFAEEGPQSRALAGRLEALVVALTPGVAATVLVPYTNGIVLGAWLVAVVIWRRFTLAPLLGLARRTQLQRDLAVAAAETERARLAADLHDDALQQVTMLVRTLDEAGQADAANTAREVADKLRAIVGDLRLPILDDLGAGAALEWLVERVEPLAGGPVRLEQSGSARPPATVELAVFRVAQEALSNAIKHGKTPITVRYEVRDDGRVTLAVEDAGPGIEPEAAAGAPAEGHFGLANMQQRAEQIGALLDVRRWPSGGTRVALEWRPT